MYTLRNAAFLALLFPFTLFSQTAADVVVPVTVTTTLAPSIILSWPIPAAEVTEVQVKCKSIHELSWTLLALLPNTATTFTDASLGIGQAREYRVEENGGALGQRVGLVYAGQSIPAVTGSRGKVILVIDNLLSAPLAMELTRFEQDLRGDGWLVLRHDITVATSTVPSVKALLRTDWEADPSTVCVLLFGRIPVPYSGEIGPDGHPEHVGAWPTDYYYGDFDEALWTDVLVNITSASRDANDNVPGDGKFDQSQTPSLPELVVGRVDFSKLNGWDVSQTELYRRYLNKNHAFRTAAYKPQNKTLVDDHFGYFAGEAFAQNGWRNGYAITGPGTVQKGAFINDTHDQSFLIGYGTGPGTYTSAGGVVTSDHFKTDSVNIVFSMIFGSYHGDWDYENNPLMPSALASKGGILTCSWAGRPNWHLHHMALGEPIYVSTYMTWLNSYAEAPLYPPNYGFDMVHVGLLGDPTLRAHSVKPPPAATATATCTGVILAWTASTDAALGYYVYRSPSQDSVFKMITLNPVLATVYTDANPQDGANFYQVKSLKKEVVASGSYFNQSIGAAAQTIYNAGPQVVSLITNVVCNGSSNGSINLTVTAGSPAYAYLWSNGATTQNLSNLPQGNYGVTVTDANNCQFISAMGVQQPSQIIATALAIPVLCSGTATGSLAVMVAGGTPGYSFLWSNAATTQNLNELPAGFYSGTVTDMQGCTKSFGNTVQGSATFLASTNAIAPSCFGGNNGVVTMTLSGGAPPFTFYWSNGATTQDLNDLTAGVYDGTFTDGKGCTATVSVSLGEMPLVAGTFETAVILCFGEEAALTVSIISGGAGGPYSYSLDNGPLLSQDVETSLGQGDHSIRFYDSLGCSTETAFVVDAPDLITTALFITPISCPNSADGLIAAEVQGGVAPYGYLWSMGSTTGSVSNLDGGEYTVTVTDANGCTGQTSGILFSPRPFVAPISGAETACAGWPETYSLSPLLSNFNWVASNNGEVTEGQGTASVTVLWAAEGPGGLSVFFNDLNGCPDTSMLAVLTNICTGTHDLSKESVTVLPNPFSDVLSIRFESGFQTGARLRLMDVQGRLILEQTLTSPEFSLQTGALPNGTYFLQIVENERTGVWNLMKQN